MTVEGRCNCGNIRVVLNEAPDASILCYWQVFPLQVFLKETEILIHYSDNCRRSGGCKIPISMRISSSLVCTAVVVN
jgi:hypothetical protein